MAERSVLGRAVAYIQRDLPAQLSPSTLPKFQQAVNSHASITNMLPSTKIFTLLLTFLLTSLKVSAQAVNQTGPCVADSDACWDVIVANTCFAEYAFGDKNQTLGCIGDSYSKETPEQKVS
jgi:hypothetical protein